MNRPGDLQELAGAEPPSPAPVPARRPARLLPLLVVAGVAGLGVPFGLAWAGVAPDVPVRLTEFGLAYAEAQPEQLIAADGWFAILALPVGVVAAVGGWLAARRLRGIAGLLLVVVGAVLAALLAWWLGRQIGLADYEAALASAEVGTELARPADLAAAQAGWWPPRVAGVLLVPATAAATTYTLLAAWSQFPSLRADEEPYLDDEFAEPGAP